MKKIILITLLCLFLIPVVSSAFKQSTVINVIEPCYKNGTYCSATSWCNVTILDPSGDVIKDNINMENQGAYFNYSLLESETEVLGEWSYDISCCDGGYCDSVHKTFKVTPNGSELSQTEAISYLGIIFILVISTGFCIYLLRKTNTLWVEALSFGLAWMFILTISYLAWVSTTNFVYQITFIPAFFKWAFIIQGLLTLPLFLGVIAWMSYMLVMTRQMRRMLERGEVGEGSYGRNIRRDLRKMRRDRRRRKYR